MSQFIVGVVVAAVLLVVISTNINVSCYDVPLVGGKACFGSMIPKK